MTPRVDKAQDQLFEAGKSAREKQTPRSLEQRFAHGRVVARARAAAWPA